MNFSFAFIVNKGIISDKEHGDLATDIGEITIGGNVHEFSYYYLKANKLTLYVIERDDNKIPEAEMLFLYNKGCTNYIGW